MEDVCSVGFQECSVIFDAGLVSGFLCCSAAFTNHAAPAMASSQSRPSTGASLAPAPSHQSATSSASTGPGSPCSSFGSSTWHSSTPENRRRHQYPQQLWASSSTNNCLATSSLPIVSFSKMRRMSTSTSAMCPNCHSDSNSDCKEGFCASVWNKENLMLLRPVQI